MLVTYNNLLPIDHFEKVHNYYNIHVCEKSKWLPYSFLSRQDSFCYFVIALLSVFQLTLFIYLFQYTSQLFKYMWAFEQSSSIEIFVGSFIGKVGLARNFVHS